MNLANVSRGFHSFDELPGIWGEIKEIERKELPWLGLMMVERRKQIKEALEFVENIIELHGFESDDQYNLHGNTRISGHYDVSSIQIAEIYRDFKNTQKFYSDEEKHLQTGIFVRRSDPGSFLSRYLFVKDIDQKDSSRNKRIFSLEIPYSMSYEFDFSELYKSKEKIISEIGKFLANN